MRGLAIFIALALLAATPCQATTWTMVGDETTCSVSLEPEPGTLIVLDKTTQDEVRLVITVDRLSLPRDWYVPFAVMTEERGFAGYGVTDASQVAMPANNGLINDLSHDNTLFVQVAGATIGPFDMPGLSADNRICILGMPNLEN